jgi:ferrochelatase
LAAEGKKDLIVVSPSFVSDCLETLEEIEIRAEEQFKKAGGNSLRLVPSLNADDDGVDALKVMIG